MGWKLDFGLWRHFSKKNICTYNSIRFDNRCKTATFPCKSLDAKLRYLSVWFTDELLSNLFNDCCSGEVVWFNNPIKKISSIFVKRHSTCCPPVPDRFLDQQRSSKDLLVLGPPMTHSCGNKPTPYSKLPLQKSCKHVQIMTWFCLLGFKEGFSK
jgi:hypothetical protein